jgi:uncharacterized protein YjbI with pentapeptide repeats
MNEYKILRRRDSAVLFSGQYQSKRRCVEAAVCAGVSLQEADLRRMNLCFAQLDGGDFRAADFS